MKFDFDEWERIFKETEPDIIFIICNKKLGKKIDPLRFGRQLPIYILCFFDKKTIDYFMNWNYPGAVMTVVIPGWETAFNKESIDLINNFVDNLEQVC